MAEVLNAFPVAILEDRYGGCYAGGRWIAIAIADHIENGAYRVIRCLEGGPHGDDCDAMDFWTTPPGWAAVGDSPDEALANLKKKLAGKSEAFAASDAR